MQAESRSIILLITQDTSLAAAMVPVFLGSGVRASIADHWTTNVSIAENLPTLLLMDAELPEGDIERMFSSARGPRTCLCRVVLMSDTVTDTWSKRLADGTIDDLIPRTPTNPRWRASLDSVLRAPEHQGEPVRWQDGAMFYEQRDPLTGLFNRSALLAALFRETDRVQRSRDALSVAMFEICDLEDCDARFSSRPCNELLRQIGQRVSDMLRSYDTVGRSGSHEFLLILPGCSAINATLLAERLLADVFSVPVNLDGKLIRLSACFGVASSDGRSPIVVLREAEGALCRAREAGPESIRIFAQHADVEIEPIEFLS